MICGFSNLPSDNSADFPLGILILKNYAENTAKLAAQKKFNKYIALVYCFYIINLLSAGRGKKIIMP